MYEWLDEYLLKMKHARKDYKAEWDWHRYLIDDKMFAAVCTPDQKHREYGGHTLVSLKCEPEAGEILRMSYKDIHPGFYMDKRNWISVFLDGSVPEEVLRTMCDNSYSLVFSKLTKKRQREILEGED